MKLGIQLHPDRGVDAVMDEARLADRQGFDSVWLSDHLMSPSGQHRADGPLDYFVLATAIGAVTSRVRLAWGMLNVSFRPPAVLAKMLASLDQITHGRVIATLGSGWFKEEYEAYGIPLVDDHDERAAFAREAVALMKELWTHPAPERVSFEGRFLRVRDLPFNPAPYQKPHPPIWLGGDSEATLQTVKQLGDGWVPLRNATREALAAVFAQPDWPTRPMTIVKGARIVVAESRYAAIEAARREYQLMLASPSPARAPASLEEFMEREIVGDVDACLQRIAEIESWGVNYLRVSFQSEAAQEAVARLLLPRLGAASAPVASGA